MLLICAGSNGKNLALTNRLAEFCTELDIEHELLDIVAMDWPLYTPDEQKKGTPKDFDCATTIRKAQGGPPDAVGIL